MSGDNSKSEVTKKLGERVPTYTPEVGSRIADAIDAVGGLRAAAKFAGVSEDSLASWRDGKTRPSFFGLLGLATAADVSLDWLATGREAERPAADAVLTDKDGEPVTFIEMKSRPAEPADEDLMGLLVDGIAAVYKEENVGLPMRDLGRLAERMRADLLDAYDDPNDRKVAVKGMLAQLRRNLREAPIGANTKRRA